VYDTVRYSEGLEQFPNLRFRTDFPRSLSAPAGAALSLGAVAPAKTAEKPAPRSG